jgi:hypothetical protein
MAGADFVKGRYLSVEYGTNRLFSVNGDNILYGTLYSSSGGLYTINTTTGTATLIAPLGRELDGFAIPTQPLIPGQFDEQYSHHTLENRHRPVSIYSHEKNVRVRQIFPHNAESPFPMPGKGLSCESLLRIQPVPVNNNSHQSGKIRITISSSSRQRSAGEWPSVLKSSLSPTLLKTSPYL